MFRTRVLYLWLQMILTASAMLLLAAVIGGLLADDFKTLVMSVLFAFPVALGACVVAIVGGFPMMSLMQWLLISVGNRSGRPAEFRTFRYYLTWYSLIPATVPVLLWLVPKVRVLGWPAIVLLGFWLVATVAVWRYCARQLHAEWQSGQPY
jgi:hypothetical protein